MLQHRKTFPIGEFGQDTTPDRSFESNSDHHLCQSHIGICIIITDLRNRDFLLVFSIEHEVSKNVNNTYSYSICQINLWLAASYAYKGTKTSAKHKINSFIFFCRVQNTLSKGTKFF